jgi:hypothetical protein
VSTLVDGLQYGAICHRGAGEIIACGWASDAILFRSATATALTADILHSAATELTVCAAVVGENDPIPRSAITQHDDGSILVAVDDGAGAITMYRCRSFADGFSEV